MKKLQRNPTDDTANAGQPFRSLRSWKERLCLGVASLLCLSVLGAGTSAQQPTTPSPKPIFETGWNPEKGPKEAAVFAAKQPPHLAKQVASLVDDSDKDALNYRFVAKLTGENPLKTMDQGQLGSCVGFGTAQAASTVQAADIVHRKQREIWKGKASGGGIYALSRTISNQNDGSEGSTGAWAMEALQKAGVLWQIDYGGGEYDLRKYDIGIIKRWQTRGIPKVLIEQAAKTPARGCYLLKTVAELKAGLQNGYACSACAAWSFVSKRDSMGFARADGKNSWNHCMAITSYRGKASGREGFLVQNSWFKDWISGGTWPADQPEGSFWITPADAQAALSQGDSWLIGDIAGFRKKDLTWAETLDIGSSKSQSRAKEYPLAH